MSDTIGTLTILVHFNVFSSANSARGKQVILKKSHYIDLDIARIRVAEFKENNPHLKQDIICIWQPEAVQL